MLLISVFVLTLLSYQDVKIKQNKRINDISTLNTINEKKVSPKGLFLESWQIIKTNYYSADLNEQNWIKWKKRYLHKIKTQEDAYVFVLLVHFLLCIENTKKNKKILQEKWLKLKQKIYKNTDVNSSVFFLNSKL